jgi:hypothetical protein
MIQPIGKRLAYRPSPNTSSIRTKARSTPWRLRSPPDTIIMTKSHSTRSPSAGIGQLAILKGPKRSLQSSKTTKTGFFNRNLLLDAKWENKAKKALLLFCLAQRSRLPSGRTPLSAACKTTPAKPKP